MNRPLPLLHPVPITLLGVKVAGATPRANFTTIGDVAIAGLNPPLVMVSLHERHFSRRCLDVEHRFSLHVPEVGMVAAVDCCGLVSGQDVDKSALFRYQWLEGAVPVIAGVPVALICSVLQRIQVEQRVIYIARVIDQIIRDDINLGDLSGLQTISYGLDNSYYTSGPALGRGYQVGKQLAASLPAIADRLGEGGR